MQLTDRPQVLFAKPPSAEEIRVSQKLAARQEAAARPALPPSLNELALEELADEPSADSPLPVDGMAKMLHKSERDEFILLASTNEVLWRVPLKLLPGANPGKVGLCLIYDSAGPARTLVVTDRGKKTVQFVQTRDGKDVTVLDSQPELVALKSLFPIDGRSPSVRYDERVCWRTVIEFAKATHLELSPERPRALAGGYLIPTSDRAIFCCTRDGEACLVELLDQWIARERCTETLFQTLAATKLPKRSMLVAIDDAANSERMAICSKVTGSDEWTLWPNASDSSRIQVRFFRPVSVDCDSRRA